MINENVAKLLNAQIQKEFYSSYLYLEIANHYSKEGLAGFENWFFVQAQEERDHALLFRTYMQNNNLPIKLLTIDAPDSEFRTNEEPLKAALEHEIYVTAAINKIYDAALEVKDFRTTEFLNWFIKEQGEEEKNAEDLIQMYHIYGKEPQSLYSLNQELSARVYAAPSLVL